MKLITLVNKTRIYIIAFIAAAISFGFSGCRSDEVIQTSEMNILQIVVEDWSAFSIGAFGNKIVKTPNVDSLAKKGVLFTRAYCQATVCNPSRASFTTGMRPDLTRVYANSEHMDDYVPEGLPFMGKMMGSQGAYTLSYGKLIHGWWQSKRFVNSFDFIDNVSEEDGFKGETTSCTDAQKENELTRNGFTYVPDKEVDERLKTLMAERKAKRASGHPRNWELLRPFQQLKAEQLGNSGLLDHEMNDGRISRCAAEKLGELAKDKRKFFMTVGLYAPHTSLLAPKKYVDMYDPDDMELSKAPQENDENIPDVALRFGRNYDIFNGDYPEYQATPERQRKAIASYYACASYVDAQIGILLQALEENGLDKNTIVVLFSDHGFHLGEHGRWSKFTLFEQSIRVPMIIYVPGAAANGKTCDEIVELVDIMPTYCDFWNIDKDKNFEGLSIAPLLENPDRQWKKAAFSVIPLGGLGRAVRTKKYKYAEYRETTAKPGSGEPYFARELYDLEADPLEQKNLVDKEEYADIANELSDLLKAGWQAAVPD
jgi:arylsulfatase A-like enzyme